MRIEMGFRTLMVGLITLMGTGTLAQTETFRDRQGYRMYAIWWQEYRSDHETALLLHFNPPQAPVWARPGDNAIAARAAAEAPDAFDDMFDDILGGGLGEGHDTSGLGDLMGATRAQQLEEKAQRDGRHATAVAPDGMVYDYSPNRADINLPDGVRIVPHGRFDAGLELDGTTGLRVDIGRAGAEPLASMEGWFKPARLPDAPVTLFEGGPNGARLILLPDGNLELLFRYDNAGERTIRTAEPVIEAGKWAHVAAYVWLDRHIDFVFQRAPRHEIRIGVNGVPVARFVRTAGHHAASLPRHPLVTRGPFFIGMARDGSGVFSGLIDEVRVAGVRRYNVPPQQLAWRDPDEPLAIAFDAPPFARDGRVFHASFDTLELTVAPEGHPRMTWEPGAFANLETMQVPGIHGHAMRIDPALGFPRIPIQGMSIEEGTFEMWFQPANWDNHTDFGDIRWGEHTMSVLRFMGRDTRNNATVPFMELTMARATIHGESEWLYPGNWRHLLFTWSPADVLEAAGWGTAQAGDPIRTFRAYDFGNPVWRIQLTRDTALIGHVEPLYVEVGINDDITVYQGQRPAIIVDEMIGHRYAFSEAEREAAPRRWGRCEEPAMRVGRYINHPRARPRHWGGDELPPAANAETD